VRIALVGYGKMGKMIEQLAASRGMEVAARFDIDDPLRDDRKTRERLEEVRVLIDFSTPEQVLKNIETGLTLGKQWVVGTTGWHQHLQSVQDRVEQAGTGLVYASNFSLGVNLFYEIAAFAGRILSRFEAYDPYIEEAHHQFKKDSPSGTALVIRDRVQKFYSREIPVSSVRAGYIPGTHSVNFDSRVDSVRLSHIARNREGFAEGALIAAEWIADQKGCYNFQDVLKMILEKEP
jgi:4-hydroxy-tetrahydrodipicolinate reductase